MTVKWHFLVAGVISGSALLSLLASAFENTVFMPPRSMPTTAPEFALVDLAGKSWTLSELKGRPVVLNFWSTWSGACKQEHPILQREPPKYPDVVFLGVIYSDDPARAREFLEKPGISFPYPSLLDPDGALASSYGVTGVPETYFVSAAGTIVHRHPEPLDRDTLEACIALARAPEDPDLVAACDGTGP